jgi:cupin 2 domain-containing protein
MKIKNIFNDIPSNLSKEILDEIISTDKIRIERIISKGQTSPENFWYDQEENEWVIVIKGKAKLKIIDEDELIELNEGDYINIPSHKKHRVEWTDPESETIWLAVFY